MLIKMYPSYLIFFLYFWRKTCRIASVKICQKNCNFDKYVICKSTIITNIRNFDTCIPCVYKSKMNLWHIENCCYKQACTCRILFRYSIKATDVSGSLYISKNAMKFDKWYTYRREQNFTHPISKVLQWLVW